MFIKSIELDGFKSYAKKQLIQGFHSQFNAITGYNGSGKSNILDGICFLLGLSKLENIRAKSMTDLIFKQGQAGVNKAVVTIVFDNKDKEKSPMGMQDYDEIVIRRQIVAGSGRGTSSSYTLNGQAATNNRVHDFFRGIGLNVNNPHFLIMQGRITKVLNMKPEEILGMIEEAAGTKMYDQKKKDAEKTIVQKDLKLGEVQKIIDDDLDPKVEKMREDRKNLIEINRLKKTREGMQRKLDAFVYWQNLNGEKENRDLVEETKEKISLAKQRIEEIDKTILEKEKLLVDIENNKNEMEANTELEGELTKRTEERVNKEGEKEEVAENMKQIEEDRKRKKTSIEKDQKLLEKKKKELDKILSEHDAVDKQQTEDAAAIQRYRSEIEALTRGMLTNENGEQVSIEQKIQQSRTEIAELEASLKTAKNRQDRLEPQVQELKNKAERMKKQNTSVMSDIKSRETEVKKAGEEMDKLNFDEANHLAMTDKHSLLVKEVQQLEGRCTSLVRNVHKGRYDFIFRDPPIPGFDRTTDVRGTVATLFRVKQSEEKYNFAIEIACGTFLSQVVVSTQNIARSMVENRVFANRKTLIPVAETRKKTQHFQARLEDSRFATALGIAKKHNEEVKHMIDLIEFPPELRIIMENILGNILVTNSLECAKEIAYNSHVRTRVVTERGDDVKPNGVMAGGHTDRSEGSVFTLLKPLHQFKDEIALKKIEVGKLAAELEKLSDTSNKYQQLKEQMENSQKRLDAINENLKNSELGVIQNELEKAMKDMEDLKVEVDKNKATFNKLTAEVDKLETRKKNDKNFQEKEKKKLRAQLEEVESRVNKSKETRENASRNILAKRAEVDELTEQIKQELINVDGRQTDIDALKVALGERQKELDEALKEEKLIRDQLDALKKKARAQDEEMKKVMKNVDSHKREKLKMTSQIENFEKEVTRYAEGEKFCKLAALKQKKRCEWIEQESQHFGKRNTEYDFEGFSEERGSSSIKDIASNIEGLERKLNTKATGNFDLVEARLQDIKGKQDRVRHDKKTILRTITVLDEKKVAEIERAHKSVNQDFGNIFSTLLPGAHAQLVAVEGKSVLDGVEVKVSFNGQLKESLTELSGGQRSLVALSLILAMLKFKPAPLYILDEVDAALDLSHTANIGKMIKTHFTNSQFVVVSLKEGMFSNADVLFQTRFCDGTSTVRRTVNNVLE